MSVNNEEIFLKGLGKKDEKKTNLTNKKIESNKIEDHGLKVKDSFVNEKESALSKLKELTKKNEKSEENTKKQEKEKIEESIKNIIKKDEKLINYKGHSDADLLAKELRLNRESDEEFPEKKILKKSKNNIIKINEFEWEKEESIETPNQEDFEKNIEKEIINHPKWIHIKKDKIKTNNSNDLNWLKKEVAGREHPKWIHKTKKDISKFDWENDEAIEEPTEKDFLREELLNKNEKINVKKNDNEIIKVNEFEWEKENPIEEPTEKDFIQKQIEKIDKLINSDINKNDNIENNITTFDWEKNELIEEPTEKDFENNSKENLEIVEHPKWVHQVNFLEGEGLKTPIDIIFEILEQYKKVDMGKAAEIAGIDYYTLEKIIKTFEEFGVIEIKYPTSLNKKPTIVLLNPIGSKIRQMPVGTLLESYTVIVDSVPAKINIITTKDEVRPIYGLSLPAIGKYTRKFLNFIKNEIAETIPIEIEEILDPKKSKKLKIRFFEESQKHLKTYFKTSKKETLDVLSGIVLHEMYGLGDIEMFLGDDMLEEVAINSSKTPLTVYHRIYGWLKTNFYPGTEEEISNYSSQIGRKIGREITTLTPILDAHLLSGDRVNATLSPISSEGNTITIRRFSRRPWTLVDFIGKAHTMNIEMAAFLWLAMQYEMNIIVAGGTASGKTSTLNTLLAMVPSYHRIISIEDVREIVLPKFLEWNWVPMVTRSANPEGLGEVTMLDCMVTSLRMRPDRIIIGEIRQKKEAEVMMEAIETGHSIYSTIHANSAYQVLRRLGEAPMSIPPMQIEQIDLIVTQFRDRKTNRRRTYEIAEIEQTSTGKGLQINTIYKWSPRNDNWDKLNKPTKIITLLNLHTGLTENEIEKELAERQKILQWLVKKEINDLNEIGFIMKKYYIDKKEVLKMAEMNFDKDDVRAMI